MDSFLINPTRIMCMYILIIQMPMVKGSIPGTFFWKPRLGLDLALPTTEPSTRTGGKSPKELIEEGLYVLVDGYQAGMSVIALASGASNAAPYPHFNPLAAHFYTHVYRWALRYLSLIPFWLGGGNINFCATHKVWKRRFYYMDELVPSWIRTLLFYVKKEDWEKEDLEYRRFKKYSESAFGKHYRFPTKKFNNFNSYLTEETGENAFMFSSITQTQ